MSPILPSLTFHPLPKVNDGDIAEVTVSPAACGVEWVMFLLAKINKSTKTNAAINKAFVFRDGFMFLLPLGFPPVI